MTPADRPGRFRRWLPALAATAGGVAAFAGALTLALTLGRPAPAPSGVPAASASYTTPPGDQVRRIHDALTDIGAHCTPQATDDDRRYIDVDVDVVLDFAQRYPNAEFAYDDETGHTLSLLLAVRDEVSHCAPAAAQRVTAVLPQQFQATTDSSPTR